MTEKRIGVTLTADPANLQAGLRQGAASTQDFAQATERSMDRAGAAMVGATKAAEGVAGAHVRAATAQQAQTAAAEAFVRGLEREVASLDRQSAAVGKTRVELLAMQAAQMGATAQAAPYIARLESMEQSALAAARAQKSLADTKAFEAKAAEAARLTQATEYVDWWTQALERAEQAERELASTRGFEQKAADARRMVQASEYTRWWADALDDADKSAVRVAASSRPAAAGLNLVGLSAGEASMAMRQLPMQVTDVITSLVSGMPVYMVAVQQGGQLRDSFHGFSNVLRGVASLISPTTLVVGALAGSAGALAVAAYQGHREIQALERALAVTGPVSAATARELAAASDRVGALTGSYGVARQAALALAQSSLVAGIDIEDSLANVVAVSELTGRSVQDVVGDFSKLREKPSEAAAELAKKYGLLTYEVYQQVDALEEQGRKAEAAELAERSMAQAADQRLAQARQNLGFLERSWDAVRNKAAGAWNAMMGIGRAPSEEELAAAAKAAQDRYLAISTPPAVSETAGGAAIVFSGNRRPGDALEEWQKAEQDLADFRAQRASEEDERQQQELENAKIHADRMLRAQADGLRSRDEQRQEEIKKAKEWADTLGWSAEQLADHLARINAKYTEKTSGPGVLAAIQARTEQERQLSAQLDVQHAALLQGETAASKLTEGQKALIAIQEKLRVATTAGAKALLQEQAALVQVQIAAEKERIAKEGRNKIQEDFEKLREQEHDAQLREISGIEQKSAALEIEIATYGLGRSAIERTTAARLRERAAALGAFAGSEKVVEGLRKEAEERERLAGLLDRKDFLDINKKAAEEAGRDWARMTDQVGQSLTDALMRGGRSGKELVEDLFRAMILRPTVQPFMQAGMNMVGQALGIPGAPGVGSSSFDITSLLRGGNISGNVGNMAQDVGHWLWKAGFEDIGSTLADNAAAIGQVANMAGNVVGYGKAIYDLTQGKIGSAAGTAIGTYILPGIGSAIGGYLGSMLDGAFMGETRSGGSFRLLDGSVDRLGGPSGGSGGAEYQFAQSLLDQTTAVITRGFEAASVDAALHGLIVAWESSEKGRGGTYSFGDLTLGGETVRFGAEGKGRGHGSTTGTIEEMMRNAEVDLWQTVIQGWQAAIDQFPPILQDMIRNVDADSLGLEAAQQLAQAFLATAEQAKALSTLLGAMPYGSAISATFEYAAALAKAAGGAENAGALVQSFHQNYWSEIERTAWLTGQVTDALAEMGYQMPKSREEYREWVIAAMAAGEASAETAAKLLGLQDALNSILPGFEAIGGTFAMQLETVRTLSAEANRLLGVRNRAGSTLDQIERALGGVGSFGVQREAELWAALAAASYEQQIDLAAELTGTVLSRYQAEIDAAERLRDIGRSLRDYVQSLTLGELSPLTLGQRLAEAGSQYATLLAQAQAGDTDAMGKLQGAADAYLNLARDYYASSDAYTQIFSYVTSSLDSLGVQAETDAQRSLSVSESSLAELESLRIVAERAYSAIDRQYAASLQALQTETSLLAAIGADTGQLNDITSLLASLPAELAARLQPLLAGAAGGVVGGWYQDAGFSDQAGQDYWAGQLQQRPAEQVRQSYLESLVRGWYQDAYGTDPDAEGWKYWAQQAGNLGAAEAYRHWSYAAGIPGYANGGMTGTGLAWVGERGPELVDFATPSRVYSNADLGRALRAPSAGDSNAVLVSEIRRLNDRIAMLEAAVVRSGDKVAGTVATSSQANAQAVSGAMTDAISRRDHDEQNKRFARSGR